MKLIFNPGICPKWQRLLLLLALVAQSGISLAQNPDIKSFYPGHAGAGKTVSILGSGFGTNPANLQVNFGPVTGRIISASANFLEVEVPTGAANSPLSVTYRPNGRIAYSSGTFFLSFGGNTGITPADLNGQFDQVASSGLYDICTCDFDGDGKTDIATSATKTTTINILQNNSTPTAPAWGAVNRDIGIRTLSAACGDLDGDGKPDLVYTEGLDGEDRRLMILRNQSVSGTISFAAPQFTTFPGVAIQRIAIRDLDGDDKPEIILSNETGGSILVLPNNSVIGSINMDPAQTLNIPQAVNTGGLAVEDLNNDGLPEIITCQFFNADGDDMFILRNSSSPGTFIFSDILSYQIDSSPLNIRVGDMDGDGKPDIVYTKHLEESIGILRNTSTGFAIQYAAEARFNSQQERSWGLDLGDLDGDGRLDIVVNSVRDKQISFLNNISTPGSLSFNVNVKPATWINRFVRVLDLNGDARQDIVFASVDDNNAGINASRVSYFYNIKCPDPVMEPSGPLYLCNGATERISVTSFGPVTYNWFLNGSPLTSTTVPFLDVNTAGDYHVRVSLPNCTNFPAGNLITVNTVTGAVPGALTASNDGPVCQGGTVTLTASSIAGATYVWEGPDGFSYTGASSNPPPITNFTRQKAGKYTVRAIIGNCEGSESSTIVDFTPTPELTISLNPAVICAGESSTMSVPALSGYNYQWARNGTPIAGASNPSYAATLPGTYTVAISSGSCNLSVASVLLNRLEPISASFTAPDIACTGQSVAFTDASNVPSVNLSVADYNWDFGDGNSSIARNATHTYNNTGTYTVTLTVQYRNYPCTPAVFTKEIEVRDGEVPVISPEGGRTAICSGGDLRLEVTGGTFTTIQWNTGETTPAITVAAPGTYSVQVESSTGCISFSEIEITEAPGPQVIVSADRELVKPGGEAILSVSGLVNFTWFPDSTLNDPQLMNPIATPEATTTYTVRGVDENGCQGEGSITIRVQSDPVNPPKVFSPNGDMVAEQWQIGNIENFPDCKVMILDRTGIVVFEAQPYLNDWDGTYNGRPLPEGAYTYVIRCEDEADSKAGTVTLLR